jgi:hypothetical protein
MLRKIFWFSLIRSKMTTVSLTESPTSVRSGDHVLGKLKEDTVKDGHHAERDEDIVEQSSDSAGGVDELEPEPDIHPDSNQRNDA